MGWLLIARFTLKEIIRKRLFLALILITTLLVGVFALLLIVAINTSLNSRSSSFNDQFVLTTFGITISLLAIWATYLMTSILTILLTVGMISGEIEAGTFSIMIPKPLRRAEIIFGKWLAYAILLSIYNAMLFTAFLGLIYWQTSYLPNNILSAYGMIELCMFILLGLTTFFGTFLPTMANGAIAIMLFIGAPFASIIQFILPTQSNALQNIGAIINLIMPTDALWHNASYFLLPPIVLDLLHTTQSEASNIPIIGAQQMSVALLIWVFLYAAGLPILAAVRFQYRDL